MSAITRKVSRWRHGHGFGVHSPFAFSFITDTLHRNTLYAYYAYSDLRALWKAAPHSRRISLHRLWAVYRIGLRFAPQAITLCDADPHGLVAAALRMAAAGVDPAAPAPKVLLWSDIRRDSKVWMATCDALDCGMSFSDGRLGVIVIDDRLPVQHFDIGL
jgi:hypothetical protein